MADSQHESGKEREMAAKVIDLTTARMGSKPDGRHPIAICPECGRNGSHTEYRDGSVCFHHKGRVEMGCILYQDYCLMR